MNQVPASVHRKIQRCLALAQDPRGDRTTAETALRQAVALMKKHGIDPATGEPVKVDPLPQTRRRSYLTPEGWVVP